MYNFDDEENANDLFKVFCDVNKDNDQWISYQEYKEWIGRLNSLHLDKILSAGSMDIQRSNPEDDDDEKKKNENNGGVERVW